MWAESAVGVGSTFHFTMLLAPASEEECRGGTVSGAAPAIPSLRSSEGGSSSGPESRGNSLPSGIPVGEVAGAAAAQSGQMPGNATGNGSDTSCSGREGPGGHGHGGSLIAGSSSSLNMSGIGSGHNGGSVNGGSVNGGSAYGGSVNGGSVNFAMSSALSASSSTSYGNSSGADEPGRSLARAFNRLGCACAKYHVRPLDMVQGDWLAGLWGFPAFWCMLAAQSDFANH